MKHSRGSIWMITAALVACSLPLFLGGCVTNTTIDHKLTSKLSSGTTITEGTLTVGVDASNSPYAGVNSSNQTVGMDVDLAAAIADELGLQLKVIDVNSNGKSNLTDKKVDLVLGMTKSGSSKTITYSDPYLYDGPSLYCLTKNKPTSIKDADLSNQKILVQANTASAFAVQEALGYSSITATSTMKDAFDELESGTATYLAADAVIGDYFARNYSDVARIDFLSASAVTPIYAVTLTSNTELTSAVSSTLSDLSQNGTQRVIIAKWLGTPGEMLLTDAVDTASLPKKFG